MRYGVEIPRGLSLIAFHDPNAVVPGLEIVPPEDRPPVVIVHLAFQVMVGIGFATLGLAAWYWLATWRARRRGAPFAPGSWLLRAIVLAMPAGFIAIEAGWIVTEVGRQPWIIWGFMRTAEAVTPMKNVFYSFGGFTLIYLILAFTTLALLIRLGRTPIPDSFPPPGAPESADRVQEGGVRASA